MNHRLLLFVATFLLSIPALRASAQQPDTIVVQTLTFDSIGRAGYYQFPDTGSFEKVIMQYTMRCHNALISNDNSPNQGCGQWDYNCESYIWDSTRTDSLLNYAPSAIISNYPEYAKFSYTTIGTSSITRRDEKLVSYPAGTTFISVTGDTTQTIPVWHQEWTKPYQRTLYVLPASKNVWRGVKNASLIQGLIYKSGIGSMYDFRIRMHTVKPGTYNTLSIFADTSFVEVFHASTLYTSKPDTLFFYNPFKWDTTSDVVMELSYAGTGSQNADTSSESALSFAGSEFVPVPATALNQIYDHVSIAFWAYGDTSYLPGTNCVFAEGLDNLKNRQINIHLPWSDGNVYWDCGGDSLGNYDRIQQALPKRYAAGRWNHWVFTKDAIAGKMSIYLNGALWLSDTGMHRPIHATEMLLGGAASSGIGYYGDVRQFAMFDAVLDSSQVTQIMMQDSAIPALQPVTYFKLNEGSGGTIANAAYLMPNSSVIGVPVWHFVNAKDLPNNFGASSFQPSFVFPNVTVLQLSDSAKPQIADHYTYDTIPDHAHIVSNYAIGHNYAFNANDSVYATDTIYGDYLATKSYTYDESGNKVDSVNVAAQDTVRPDTLFYFTRGPQKFELMSFVTPYGLGLDLGKTGKMWEFDVTDYLPIMKGWHRLTMERGSGQEEFDLKFLFIKGTPARNVIDLDQIWPMTEENYQTIQSNLRYQPLSVYLEPSAKAYKLRSYITGHGQQGEFIPQTHYISVDNTKYERLVYKICSLDPLYPQGGTWTYDRSGWCPGMATDLAEYEITGTVTPGDSVTIDYGVEPGPTGDSRYDPGTQLVSYGPPNFTLDAAIVNIQRPSPLIAYGRINPACDRPIVFIKNNGSQTLTSLQFDYYVDNGPHETFQWTGSLPFLDTASVTLPVDSLNFWTSADSGGFHVDISKPNGGTDQYDQDDHYSTSYKQPPAYNGIVVVNLYTNNDPQDNYYEVLDHDGDTVFSNGNFDATTSYYDSLILPVGCYTLVFHDDGEDGLSYWANPDQGNGYLRLRQTSKTGKILNTFNPDFGMGVQYDFSIVSSPLAVGTTQPQFRHVGLYPNPTAGELNIDLEGMPDGMITLEVIDATGRTLRREQRFTDPLGALHSGMDLTGIPAGNYFLRVTTTDGQTTQNFVVE